MRILDTLHFARHAAIGSPLRTCLLILAISIGVAAVVILTALGEGARRYVVGQFSYIGSNLVIVLPGRSDTRGFNPANLVTSTSRDLTVQDASALIKLHGVLRISPIVIGTTEIYAAGKLREAMMVGTNANFLHLRKLKLGLGHFLSNDTKLDSSYEVVIGAQIRKEIFGLQNPLGKIVRIGDRRLRVVGVLSEGGQSMGMTTDELVIVKVTTAQSMLNTNTLFRILVEARDHELLGEVKNSVMKLISQRHQGEEDVTVITQDSVLEIFDKILNVLTIGAAGICAISLVVAGILVMNVMLVSVTQRTGEVGLLLAIGATSSTILQLFLVEAILISLTGGIVGVGLGYFATWILRHLYATFPAYPPLWAVAAGFGTAILSGVIFGVIPARNAAKLDPVKALTIR